jgi:hypothetical protein
MTKASLTLYLIFLCKYHVVVFSEHNSCDGLNSNLSLKCDTNTKLINTDDYSSDESNDITF